MIPRRWFWLAFVLGALVAMCAPQMARATGGPVLQATSITGITRGPTGLSGALNAVLIETDRRSYHQGSVSIPWGTLGGAAKAGMRGVVRYSPYVGMALTAAEIAGWVRDADWFNKGDGVPSREIPGGTRIICADSSRFNINASYCVEEARRAEMGAFLQGKQCVLRPGSSVTGYTLVNAGGYDTVRVDCKNNGVLTQTLTISGTTLLPSGYKTPEYREPTTVTVEEMAETIANNWNNHYKMLHDMNGSPHPFPEVHTALSGMAASIGAATGNTPTVDGAPVNPDDTSPTDPAPPTSGQGAELPAFCEWAGVVCQFIEWYKNEGDPLEEVPVPFEDEEPIEMSDWSSGQSGGTCPSPEAVSVMGADIEFSYEPICLFVGYLYWAIIAGATIVAGFILAGLRGVR